MARRWQAGGELFNPGITVDTPDGRVGNAALWSRDTAVKRTGAASWKYNSGASNLPDTLQINQLTALTVGGNFVQVAFQTAAAPSAAFEVFQSIATVGATPVAIPAAIRIRTDGAAELLTEGVVRGSPSAASVCDGTQHILELSVTYDASFHATAAELRVDFASVATWTGAGTISGIGTPGFGAPQAPGANYVINFDDCVYNDGTGAVNNSWPNGEKVGLALPISDSAVGTGWTLGTGTAIAGNSGSTAVKNTPPLGVADLAAGSDTKQIRNSSSNANTSYDANLTTYTSLGIGASDTVNAVQPIVATASPVATSAKQGTVGISSNPVIANVALGAGGTSGAFWSGAAGGTYPTGWKWSYGTMTETPTVTLGNSPVARITQVTSSTRIAVVCFLGAYVGWLPAATALPPHPTVVDTAVDRAANY